MPIPATLDDDRALGERALDISRRWFAEGGEVPPFALVVERGGAEVILLLGEIWGDVSERAEVADRMRAAAKTMGWHAVALASDTFLWDMDMDALRAAGHGDGDAASDAFARMSHEERDRYGKRREAVIASVSTVRGTTLCMRYYERRGDGIEWEPTTCVPPADGKMSGNLAGIIERGH